MILSDKRSMPDHAKTHQKVRARVAKDLANLVIHGSDWTIFEEVIKGWQGTCAEEAEWEQEDSGRQEMAAVAKRELQKESTSWEDEEPGEGPASQIKDLSAELNRSRRTQPLPPFNLDLLSSELEFVEEQRNDPTLSRDYEQLAHSDSKGSDPQPLKEWPHFRLMGRGHTG